VALIAALPSLPLAAASDPASATSVSGAGPAQPKSSMQAAVRAAAIRNAAVVAAPRGTSSSRAAQAPAAKQSTGFFRSKPGAIALAVMAAGTGYAIYSVSHDRITSPAKQ